MSDTITVAAPPAVADVSADMISWMAAQSGVQTDYNVGGQFRTNSEAFGSVVDMQGVIAQALAFQALVYAAFTAFNIFPLPAVPAQVTVTFATGTGGSPPPAVSNVTIPAGTLVSTVGGTQFETTAQVVLLLGQTTVNAPAQAVIAGLNGNVAANSIVQIVSGLGYPLFVNNTSPAAEGSDAETPPQTLARFTAKVASLGLSTPVAIANACIGVTASGTAETVHYSTVYEPWIALGLSGTASFEVFIDNGSGAASTALIDEVIVVLNGNQSQNLAGFRPAGVPFTVNAVIPVNTSVVVSGTAILPSLDSVLTSNTSAAINSYYTSLQFGQPAELTQIIAAVANAVAGNVSSLSVWLLDNVGDQQTVITPLAYQRIILQSSTVVYN